MTQQYALNCRNTFDTDIKIIVNLLLKSAIILKYERPIHTDIVLRNWYVGGTHMTFSIILQVPKCNLKSN